MHSLLENLDPWARVGLQALLNSFWQGLLIVGLVWLLFRLIGRVSATTRHALWLVSLLTIGLLPLIGLFFPVNEKRQRQGSLPEVLATNAASLKVLATLARANLQRSDVPIRRVPVLPPSQAKADWEATITVQHPAAAPGAQGALAQPVTLSATLPTLPHALSEASALTLTVKAAEPAALLPPTTPANLRGRFSQWLYGRAPLFLAVLWLVVAGALSGRIVVSYLHLFKLRRRLSAAPVTLEARTEELAAHFGIRRQVQLAAAESVKMPLTIGWLHPLIVLPQDLLGSLSSAECDSVIAHELAHIKRWDYATNFIQRILQALLFFHPAVWFINKQLVIERELACDDWAVKLTGEPRRYASCLTKLVELLSESKPLAAATGILFGKHIISRRVEMILNRDRNATTSVSKPALAYAISLAFLFVFVCSTLSPVIAVPLAQKPAKKSADAKAPSVPKTVPATPSPSAAPAIPSEPADVADFPLHIEINGEFVDIPALPALADLQGSVNDALRSLDHLELAQVQDALQIVQDVAPLAPISPAAPVAAVPALGWAAPFPPAPAQPAYPGVYGVGQSSGGEKAKTPAIPENELLSLLSDIVKKDADENVRREALQGIYRLRTDAAINTLIQLYDATSEVKTKSEILGYLMRRNGDNSKATAKLVQIAKTEKNEALLGAALSQLAYVKGDEGADQLISIYDGMQDPKLKQRVIRSLAYNKSKKAIDKLMSIAKSDSDPAVRQAAIRSLYAIDNQLYLNYAEGNRVGQTLLPKANFEALREMKGLTFDFDNKKFQMEKEAMEKMQEDAREMQERAQEKMREMQERMRENWRDEKPRATQPRTNEERREYEREQQRQRNNNQDQEQKSSGQAPAKLKTAPRAAVTL